MNSSVRKYLKVFLNLSLVVCLFLGCIFLVPKLLWFFLPFVAGYIIALIASPVVRFLEEKLKVRRKAGTAFVIIAVIALVVLVIYLIVSCLTEEVQGFITELPLIWNDIEKDISKVGVNLSSILSHFSPDIQDASKEAVSEANKYVGSLISKISTPTITAVGNFAKQIPSVVIGVIITLLSSYFFVAEKYTVSGFIKRHFSVPMREKYEMLRGSVVKAVGGYFKAQLKIEAWMYLLLVVGFSILQVDYALLIALGVAFLDFLPFLGTGTVLIPWSIVKFLTSDYPMAIALLVIWGVGQFVRQLIQPKIVGDSVGVSPLPTLFLLFIGFRFGGVLGMIVAVPLGLIVYTMYREGVFDTSVNSLKILIAGINNFRKLTDEDMSQITPHVPRGHEKEEKQETEK